jgi:hypothetical protein
MGLIAELYRKYQTLEVTNGYLVTMNTFKVRNDVLKEHIASCKNFYEYSVIQIKSESLLEIGLREDSWISAINSNRGVFYLLMRPKNDNDKYVGKLIYISEEN